MTRYFDPRESTALQCESRAQLKASTDGQRIALQQSVPERHKPVSEKRGFKFQPTVTFL